MTALGQQKTLTIDVSAPTIWNPAYVPLLKADDEFIHLCGGAGSGKSRFEAQKEIVQSYESVRKNRNTLVIRKVGVTLKDSVYAELKSVIYQWKLDGDFEIARSPLGLRNKITDVRFLFIGLDDVEKVKSISGVDRIWIEEATELATISELDQLRLRLRGFEKTQITLSYNPTNIFHWLSTEIHQKRPAGHRILLTTYHDNVRLLAIDPHYADSIERLKETNPNYYRVYGLGEWGQNAEGLIYPDHGMASEMPCPPQAYGLDFGFNEPSALVAIAIIDEPGKDKKQLYLEERLYETKLTSDALIARMEAMKISKSIPIVADNARPEMIESLRRAGFWIVESQKGAGSVKAGINTVKLHDIRIVAGSKNAMREITNYSWKNKNGAWLDEPQEGIEHLLDGTRYACTYLAKPNSSGSEDVEEWY